MVADPPRVISVVIVGGGICECSSVSLPRPFLSITETILETAGIAQAVRLQEALGDKVEFKIYERSYDVGGVWRDSTWPGAGCVR